MTQTLFNAITHALIQLYYGEDFEPRGFNPPTGPSCYLEAERQLAEDFPEMRKVWWKDNSWRFNGFPE